MKENMDKDMRKNKRILSTLPPCPPFLGTKIVGLALGALFDHLNLPALYRIGWGAGKASGEKWSRMQHEFAERLEKMKNEIIQQEWLHPRAAYGYWRCTALEDAILIYPDPAQNKSKTIRLTIPRQPFSPNRSLCDYFKPEGKGELDVIAMQIVSMGDEAVDHIRQLQQEDSVEAFFAHGLATQLTEAAAQYVLSTIRNELNLEDKRGKRYSWGYEPLPDLSQQVSVMQLLDPDNSLGIFFTSAYQFIPEYTTAALFVHHPQAEYFRIKTKEHYAR